MDTSVATALNPPLLSARLNLEPLLRGHADELFGLLSEERIYRWISSAPPTDVELLRAAWRRGESRVSPDGTEAWLNWALLRRDNGSYVGILDVTVDDGGIAVNLGYRIFTGHCGEGYATEATRVVVAHLVSCGIGEIRAYVTSGNDASERVLIKCGFMRTRVLPDNDRIRGVLHDDVEYVFRPTTSGTRSVATYDDC